jgi:hypothetical protein
MVQDAVVRNLEIIGEAVKHVTAHTRAKRPDVPWSAIAGMRDRLIHDYFRVDLNIAWDVVANDLPQRDSKACAGERPATVRNDPQREPTGAGARSLCNVAEGVALDDSLDDSGGGGRLEPEVLAGVVETALAEALGLAADAGRWEIVAQLADELAIRRHRRDPVLGDFGDQARSARLMRHARIRR